MARGSRPAPEANTPEGSGVLLPAVLACAVALALAGETLGRPAPQEADLVLHGGKVVAMERCGSSPLDRRFLIHEALAVRGERLLLTGSDEDVLRTRGSATKTVDLQGRTVLPGLIDSHVHPTAAAMTEFDHPVPSMESVADVLDYVRSRAAALEDGEWIVVRQVFITRLRERRYPTRGELDRAAPRHPVVFSTGPDAALNSLALELSGIDRNFQVTDGGPGHLERDPRTGEPTGILRNLGRFVRSRPSGRQPGEPDRIERLRQLLRDYNASGLTSIGDRKATEADVRRYELLLERQELTVRVFASWHIDPLGPVDEVRDRIRAVSRHPLCRGGERASSMLRIGGIKTFLDGGMLTGSAYMREPWGASEIYSIDDPEYRGILFIPKERLRELVRTAAECGLQFTAHSVGDGAVHTLLEVYEDLSRSVPLRATRPCITHSNFMSREAIRLMAELGVVADIQPAWLLLDASTLVEQFGLERLRYFQPLRSLFAAGAVAGGGSDHMQKIGSMRSVNPYNPFLGMWVAISRQARNYEGALHPEEALDREQALRFYTLHNAYLLFQEEETGSLESGKLADFIVVDRDLLTCRRDEIPGTRVLRTYVGGRLVYESG